MLQKPEKFPNEILWFKSVWYVKEITVEGQGQVRASEGKMEQDYRNWATRLKTVQNGYSSK